MFFGLFGEDLKKNHARVMTPPLGSSCIAVLFLGHKQRIIFEKIFLDENVSATKRDKTRQKESFSKGCAEHTKEKV